MPTVKNSARGSPHSKKSRVVAPLKRVLACAKISTFPFEPRLRYRSFRTALFLSDNQVRSILSLDLPLYPKPHPMQINPGK